LILTRVAREFGTVGDRMGCGADGVKKRRESAVNIRGAC
jgi:hypothetical protein